MPRSRGATLAGACIGLLLALLPAQGRAATADQATRPAAARDGLMQVAGLRQWMSCAGSGPLTLVVIPGLGASGRQWSTVLPALQGLTRTCIYDRPGLGHSPARANSAHATDAGAQAAELHALLIAAGEPGPYAVLGHSYGGLIARAFVRQHLDETAALMLLEAVDPSATGGSVWHEAGQAVDMRRSRAAARGGPGLGQRPLVVLSASAASGDHLPDPSAPFGRLVMTDWLRDQRASTRLSGNALWVVAHSGHVVQQDNPRATVQAVRELLASAADGSRLHCTAVWSGVDARCEPAVEPRRSGTG